MTRQVIIVIVSNNLLGNITFVMTASTVNGSWHYFQLLLDFEQPVLYADFLMNHIRDRCPSIHYGLITVNLFSDTECNLTPAGAFERLFCKLDSSTKQIFKINTSAGDRDHVLFTAWLDPLPQVYLSQCWNKSWQGNALYNMIQIARSPTFTTNYS